MTYFLEYVVEMSNLVGEKSSQVTNGYVVARVQSYVNGMLFQRRIETSWML